MPASIKIKCDATTIEERRVFAKRLANALPYGEPEWLGPFTRDADGRVVWR